MPTDWIDYATALAFVALVLWIGHGIGRRRATEADRALFKALDAELDDCYRAIDALTAEALEHEATIERRRDRHLQGTGHAMPLGIQAIGLSRFGPQAN